jgi:hypothetical protein
LRSPKALTSFGDANNGHIETWLATYSDALFATLRLRRSRDAASGPSAMRRRRDVTLAFGCIAEVTGST